MTENLSSIHPELISIAKMMPDFRYTRASLPLIRLFFRLIFLLPKTHPGVRIERTLFGIRFHPSGVWYVMRWMGWSSQKPTRQAIQLDDAAIEDWIETDWPRIRKVVLRFDTVDNS